MAFRWCYDIPLALWPSAGAMIFCWYYGLPLIFRFSTFLVLYRLDRGGVVDAAIALIAMAAVAYQGNSSPLACQKLPEFSRLRASMRSSSPRTACSGLMPWG